MNEWFPSSLSSESIKYLVDWRKRGISIQKVIKSGNVTWACVECKESFARKREDIFIRFFRGDIVGALIVDKEEDPYMYCERCVIKNSNYYIRISDIPEEDILRAYHIING